MAIKRLGSPFPTAILPAPDGTIDALDRAALAIGWPLSTVAPPAPPPPAQPMVRTGQYWEMPVVTRYLDGIVIPIESLWQIEVRDRKESPLAPLRLPLASPIIVLASARIRITAPMRASWGKWPTCEVSVDTVGLDRVMAAWNLGALNMRAESRLIAGGRRVRLVHEYERILGI